MRNSVFNLQALQNYWLIGCYVSEVITPGRGSETTTVTRSGTACGKSKKILPLLPSKFRSLPTLRNL